jgi:nitrate/nitrite transport system permease protein
LLASEEPSLAQELKLRHRLFAVLLGLILLGGGLYWWEKSSTVPAFDPKKYTAEQLEEMELSGELTRTEDDRLVYNADRQKSFPGPLDVWQRVKAEFAEPFHRKGTNDHGIGWLIVYSICRFAVGFLAASVVAILVGTIIGMSPTLFGLLNPVIQVLKPISPLAWMPLLLYSVKDSMMTGVLVVFLASLWPTIANTAFGVQSMRKEYLQVGMMLELGWWNRLVKVIIPAAAPAIVAGLRISFGSALIAVVPAEMLLGELGVGYLTWNYWNNLDLAGVLFAILVVSTFGVTLDLAFQQVARLVKFAE